MPDTKNIHVVVITPERQVVDQPADSVVIPAHDGELGILRDRAALMCELGIGQLRYTHDHETGRMFIDGGFAQVFENRVTVLTKRALPVDAITPEVIKNAEEDVAAHVGTEADTVAERERAQRRLSVLRSLRNTL